MISHQKNSSKEVKQDEEPYVFLFTKKNYYKN